MELSASEKAISTVPHLNIPHVEFPHLDVASHDCKPLKQVSNGPCSREANRAASTAFSRVPFPPGTSHFTQRKGFFLT